MQYLKGIAIRTYEIVRGQKFTAFAGQYNVDLITMFNICKESTTVDRDVYANELAEVDNDEEGDYDDCNYEEEFDIETGYFDISWSSDDGTFGVEGYLVDGPYHLEHKDSSNDHGFESADYPDNRTEYDIDGLEELTRFHSRMLDDDQGWGVLDI